MSYVLVVDDEPPIRKILVRWLTDWGHVVQQAGTAAEALEAMRAEPPTIIFCDVHMPGQNGLWLAEQVREHWPQTAIIMASAADDLPTVTKSHGLGAVDYISKPLGREMVRQALRRATDRISLVSESSPENRQ